MVGPYGPMTQFCLFQANGKKYIELDEFSTLLTEGLMALLRIENQPFRNADNAYTNRP